MRSDDSAGALMVFDLGGTWFRWGRYSQSHGLAECRRVPAVNYLSHPHLNAVDLQETMVEFIAARVKEMRGGNYGDIKVVGVSVGAPVNAHNGIVLGSGPLWGPMAASFPLRERLQEELPEIAWHVINDIAALLAPYMLEDASFSKTMLVTVSSGIGSRLFDHINCRIPYEEKHGIQGEIGHLPCTFELGGRWIERRCECGGRNHLNAFASGRGIASTLATLPSFDAAYIDILPESPAAWVQADDNYRLKALQVALRKGNSIALALLDTFVTPLTRVLATALTLDPDIERIVMTGGVVHGLGKHYRDSLQRTFLRDELYQITASDPTYLTRRLYWEEPDDFSGLRGTGVYTAALQKKEDRNGLSN